MDILSDKIVITRKQHRCSACGRMFEKGTKMRTQVNTYDGIQTWRECPTCQELLNKHRKHFADDYENVCMELCVNEVLERGQTPEELLCAMANSSNENNGLHKHAVSGMCECQNPVDAGIDYPDVFHKCSKCGLSID